MKREREEAAQGEQDHHAVRHCPGLMALSNGSATKSIKYDRQLRIWGEQGQLALEQACVCLLNCSATGSEALKNLVLGGVGSVTIVDPNLVQEPDLGNNFLLRSEDVGQPRSKCVAALLREMNELVVIDHIEASPELLIDSDPNFFAKFTLVIATQMRESSLTAMDSICRNKSIPLLVARSYGLVGLVRASVSEHAVVETKPDSSVNDLRLHDPWPELAKLVSQFDIDTSDPVVHKHIPFAVILLKLSENWKKSHGGSLPSNSKERSEFKAMILAGRRSEDEDNYKEALGSAFMVWSPPTVSSELKAILEDPASDVNAGSSEFWILVAALKRFIANEGRGELPLDGAIPDMHSFTEYYIQLQKCYQERAEADVSAMEGHVGAILKQIGRDVQEIPRASVKNFCKNSRNLRVARYPRLSEEYAGAGNKLRNLLPFDDEKSNYMVYLLFRAVDRFYEAHGRFPGTIEDEVEGDVSKLTGMVCELGFDGGAVAEELVSEFCRFGAGEVHCVAAVVGGIASQEAIKLVTKQFTPVLGTLLYNAIASTSTVLQLWG